MGPAEQVLNAGFAPSTGRIATELGGVTVTFDGVPAPMFFSQALQLNLQVPFEVAGRSSTEVVITFRGQESTPITVPVVASKPGIFAIGSQAIVVREDGSLSAIANPVVAGEYVTIFGTGQGEVDLPVASGAPALADPLSVIRDSRVRIGGVEIPAENIAFAGMTPGFAGLFQINIKIPSGLPIGESVEIVVIIRGAESVPLTISVAG